MSRVSIDCLCLCIWLSQHSRARDFLFLSFFLLTGGDLREKQRIFLICFFSTVTSLSHNVASLCLGTGAGGWKQT